MDFVTSQPHTCAHVDLHHIRSEWALPGYVWSLRVKQDVQRLQVAWKQTPNRRGARGLCTEKGQGVLGVPLIKVLLAPLWLWAADGHGEQ